MAEKTGAMENLWPGCTVTMKECLGCFQYGFVFDCLRVLLPEDGPMFVLQYLIDWMFCLSHHSLFLLVFGQHFPGQEWQEMEWFSYSGGIDGKTQSQVYELSFSCFNSVWPYWLELELHLLQFSTFNWKTNQYSLAAAWWRRIAQNDRLLWILSSTHLL